MDKNGAKQCASAEEIVAAWNLLHPVGEEVVVTGDMGEKWRTTTRSMAWVLDSGRTPVVQLKGRPGCYLLDRVKPVSANTVVSVAVTETHEMSPGEAFIDKAAVEESARAMADTVADRLDRLFLSYLFNGVANVEPPCMPSSLLWMNSGAAATATDGISAEPALTVESIAETMAELDKARTVYYQVTEYIDKTYEGKDVLAFMYEWEGDRVYVVHPDNLSRFLCEVEGAGLKPVEYDEEKRRAAWNRYAKRMGLWAQMEPERTDGTAPATPTAK